MKKSILIIAIAFISSIAVAQAKNNGEVPKKISEAFSQKYSSAEIKKRETRKGDYMAEFNLEKKRFLAYYSANSE
ncbi:MAG: hypothetical protein JST87_17220 [Bacteroidetes bacterium]|nr:hypothetical protein [Bacteroidota bacterium]